MRLKQCGFLVLAGLILAACTVIPNGSPAIGGATAADANDYIIAITTPTLITIEIMSRGRFAAAYPSDAIAAAEIHETPCRIVLREGMAIRYTADPATPHPHAEFADSANADTIAHEALHCLLGKWHSS
jgi:hypothetical protein